MEMTEMAEHMNSRERIKSMLQKLDSCIKGKSDVCSSLPSVAHHLAILTNVNIFEVIAWRYGERNSIIRIMKESER